MTIFHVGINLQANIEFSLGTIILGSSRSEIFQSKVELFARSVFTELSLGFKVDESVVLDDKVEGTSTLLISLTAVIAES